MPSDPVFSRQEVISLTGSTSNRLQFLERSGLIIPHRIGKSKKPVVLYTWEQIVALKVLDGLRTEDMRELAQTMHAIGMGDAIAYVSLVMVPVNAIAQQLLAQAKACETVDYADVVRRLGR